MLCWLPKLVSDCNVSAFLCMMVPACCGQEGQHAECLLVASEVGTAAGRIFFTQETENSEVLITANITGESYC